MESAWPKASFSMTGAAVVLSLLVAHSSLVALSDPTQAQTTNPARPQLQVLGDVPESQLFPVMNAVATSLGVGCDYCHVRDAPNPNSVVGGWHFERDDKPAKAKGREMMRMVREINASRFGGKTVVTCFTCHRGETKVLGAPPLPPNERPGPVGSPVALPSVQTVLQKYAAAVGGADLPARFATTVLQGHDDRSENRHGDIVISWKGTDRFRVDLSWPSQPPIAQAFAGTVAWVSNGTTPSQVLPAPDAVRLRRLAMRYAPLKVPESPDTMRVDRVESVRGRDAYVVLASVDANVTRAYYFDVATGLLVREITTTMTPFLPIQEQVEYDDYRAVDGIKLPFVVRSSDEAPYDTSTKTFVTIRHDVPVDDALFVIPRR